MSTLATSNLKNASATNPNIVLNTDGTIGGDCLTQTCRAWVNFDGTGTPSIRGQYNVSSITDNGTGDYTVNFTTALPDTNYSAVASTGAISTAVWNGSESLFLGASSTGSGVGTYSTTAVSLICFVPAASAYRDETLFTVAIFR
jgi:hypothetical protein